MQEIQYLGEHLWLGNLGHFCVILAFVSAISSIIAYISSSRSIDSSIAKGWQVLGKWTFFTHSLALFSLMGLLFYAMYHHMYEYSYVFDHVSPDLPLKYILSAFWEGQEGSFLLWMVWHAVLGIIVISRSDSFQPQVMAVIAFAQAILMTMVLGIHIPIGNEIIKIGSSPFTLLRHMNDAPIFLNADYLSLIKGRGLNPLLQNYWMTIHPPTLFLGFASTLVPFAYAIAGLWRNDHAGWMKFAFPWALFSGGILGTGILMGSLWAYVALSFGGYWAWDPVENASLVPWMTLVAGIHVHLVSKNTGFATRSVYFFYLITFLLILYSTFLTRSGVLGDTSAHAFTEMGLEWQLIILLGSFALLGFVPWILRFRQIPHPKKEEHIASREFWMYIGTMVIVFGAFLITASTSLPVYNKIMTWINPAWEGRVIQDVIDHYNKYQLWIAVFVCLLSGLSLFLRYSAANWSGLRYTYLRRMAMHGVMAGILTGLTALWIDFMSWQFVILGFSGLFGMTTGLDYLLTKGVKSPALAWSSLSHLGFGMMILGTITSGLNQSSISSNPFVFKGIFSEEDLKKYVQLIKGKSLLSQGHLITYQSDTLVGRERIYAIHFQKLKEDFQVEDEWTLHPTALYSNDYSKIAAFNPDTRHHIDRDIFTCVVGLPPAVESMEKAKKIEDTLRFKPIEISFNDTIDLGDYILKAGDASFAPTNTEYLKNSHDAGLSVALTLYDKKRDTTYLCQPALGIQGALLYNYPEGIEDAGMKFKILDDNVESFFTPEDQLSYQEFTLKDGESFKIGQTTVRLAGFNKSPVSPAYTTKEGDLAVGARLEVMHEGNVELAEPIYVIRDNQPMSIKSYTSSCGLHVRFANIDPKSETFTFRAAQDHSRPRKIKIGWATGVPRSDYVILQATIFPGINLFWAGSILMMAGLLGAGGFRFLKRRS